MKSVFLCICALLQFSLVTEINAQKMPFMPQHDSYNLSFADIHWTANPISDSLKGEVCYYFKADSNIDTFALLLHDSLKIHTIESDGISLSYLRPGNHQLLVLWPHIMPAGDLGNICIKYSGIPGDYQGDKAYFRGAHNNVSGLWTISEPYSALCWWPVKISLDDKIDSLHIRITHPDEYRAVTNGVYQTETHEGNQITSYWAHKYPVTAYLVGFAITNYAKYTDWYVKENDSIAIHNYVYPEDSANLSNVTPGLLPVMDIFRVLYGEYPFYNEHYGHAQCGMGGGMENQTMTFMGYFNHHIMSHELAHSWFGNMITCGSWEDIWLNEGFATYSTGLTYEYLLNGFYWDKWKRETIANICTQNGGSVWVNDTTNASRIFDSRLSYNKGAYLLHMLRWVCGDPAFFKSILEYTSKPELRYAYARTSDFINILEAESGISLEEFMTDWFYGEGFPSYTIQWKRLESTALQLKIFQTTSHSSVNFFEMPLPIKLKGSYQDSIIILNHNLQGQIFTVDPGFWVDSVFFDPERWIVSSGNQVTGTEEPEKTTFAVFPNPVIDLLNVRFPSGNPPNYKIYNLDASLLQEGNLDKNTINFKVFAPGVYIIKIDSGKASAIFRIIKL